MECINPGSSSDAFKHGRGISFVRFNKLGCNEFYASRMHTCFFFKGVQGHGGASVCHTPQNAKCFATVCCLQGIEVALRFEPSPRNLGLRGDLLFTTGMSEPSKHNRRLYHYDQIQQRHCVAEKSGTYFTRVIHVTFSHKRRIYYRALLIPPCVYICGVSRGRSKQMEEQAIIDFFSPNRPEIKLLRDLDVELALTIDGDGTSRRTLSNLSIVKELYTGMYHLCKNAAKAIRKVRFSLLIYGVCVSCCWDF